MTKKDFIAIASVLKAQRLYMSVPAASKAQFHLLVAKFSFMLKEQNPRFSVSKFEDFIFTDEIEPENFTK